MSSGVWRRFQAAARREKLAKLGEEERDATLARVGSGLDLTQLASVAEETD